MIYDQSGKEIRPFGFALDLDNATKEEIEAFKALWNKIKPTELREREKTLSQLQKDANHYKGLWQDQQISARISAIKMAFIHTFINGSLDSVFNDAELIYQWIIKENDRHENR